MRKISRTAYVIQRSKIMKVDKNTKHLSIDDIQEGQTYQTHVRNIVKVISIKDGYVMLRNISLNCNQRIELKNTRFVKQF